MFGPLGILPVTLVVQYFLYLSFPICRLGIILYLFYRLHDSGALGSLRMADVCAFIVLFVQVFLLGIFSGQVLSGQQVTPVNLKAPRLREPRV